jgi:hypothetical protein
MSRCGAALQRAAFRRHGSHPRHSPGHLPGLRYFQGASCQDVQTAGRAAPISHAMLGAMQGKPGMIFTIEFFRIRPTDDAHATLDRLSVIVDDLEAAKVKARSLFETLEMPQKPDGLRILDESGCELFFWDQGKDDA